MSGPSRLSSRLALVRRAPYWGSGRADFALQVPWGEWRIFHRTKYPLISNITVITCMLSIMLRLFFHPRPYPGLAFDLKCFCLSSCLPVSCVSRLTLRTTSLWFQTAVRSWNRRWKSFLAGTSWKGEKLLILLILQSMPCGLSSCCSYVPCLFVYLNS